MSEIEHDESVYKVLHFKKRNIAGSVYNLVKRTEILCENCLRRVASENAKHPDSWDLVIEEEIVAVGARKECVGCIVRKLGPVITFRPGK